MRIIYLKNAPNAEKWDIKEVQNPHANILIKLGIAKPTINDTAITGSVGDFIKQNLPDELKTEVTEKDFIQAVNRFKRNIYSDFNKDKLIAECQKRGLKVKKKITNDDLINLLITDDINKETN